MGLGVGGGWEIGEGGGLTCDGPGRFAMPGDVNYRKLVVHICVFMPLLASRRGRAESQEPASFNKSVITRALLALPPRALSNGCENSKPQRDRDILPGRQLSISDTYRVFWPALHLPSPEFWSFEALLRA